MVCAGSFLLCLASVYTADAESMKPVILQEVSPTVMPDTGWKQVACSDPKQPCSKNIKLFKSAKQPTESNYFYLWDPDSLLLQKIELATSPFWTLVNSWDLKRFDTREDKERVRE